MLAPVEKIEDILETDEGCTKVASRAHAGVINLVAEENKSYTGRVHVHRLQSFTHPKISAAPPPAACALRSFSGTVFAFRRRVGRVSASQVLKPTCASQVLKPVFASEVVKPPGAREPVVQFFSRLCAEESGGCAEAVFDHDNFK